MTAADDRYGDLLQRLGWTEAGPPLLRALDDAVGERLVEAGDEIVDAVRRLHAPRTFQTDGYSWKVCVEDRQAWPCATEETLRDVTGGFPSDAEWEAWR